MSAERYKGYKFETRKDHGTMPIQYSAFVSRQDGRLAKKVYGYNEKEVVENAKLFIDSITEEQA
jgi:hypothetical protein